MAMNVLHGGGDRKREDGRRCTGLFFFLGVPRSGEPIAASIMRIPFPFAL
jgi:hypothetical protein